VGMLEQQQQIGDFPVDSATVHLALPIVGNAIRN
jgi:hypothetical protein